MDLMKEVLLYGLYCGGLGVGLTMIRSISTYTLKYVFVASFFCGSIYTLVNTLTGWTLLAAFAAAFAAATAVRRRAFRAGSPPPSRAACPSRRRDRPGRRPEREKNRPIAAKSAPMLDIVTLLTYNGIEYRHICSLICLLHDRVKGRCIHK